MVLSLSPGRPRRRGLMLGVGLAALFLGMPAHAATPAATAEGAKAIAEGFAHYFGRAAIDKGIITVTPSGDHYDLTYAFDGARMGLPTDGPRIQFSPVTLQLTPTDDGTYAFKGNNPSIDLSFETTKDGQPVAVGEHLKNCAVDGLFDLKSMAFPVQRGSCDSVAFTFRSPIEDADASMGRISFQGTAKPAGNGDLDVAMTSDSADLIETITLKDPRNPMPPIAVRADKAHQEATIAGLRNTQLLEAFSFYVDRSFNIGPADQGAAVAKLKAVLPLWQKLDGHTHYQTLSIGTPKGIVKVASVVNEIVLDGAVKNAEAGIDTSFSGLELPEGMVPDWAVPLVPKDAKLNFKLTGLDLGAMASKVAETLGSPKAVGQPDALRAALLGVLMAEPPNLSFEQTAAAPAFDVKGQGDTSLTPTQHGKAAFSASSLDGVMAAFSKAAATVPQSSSALAGAGIAFLKGLAKAGPDGRLTWDIDFDSAAKTVTVNGQTFGPDGPK